MKRTSKYGYTLYQHRTTRGTYVEVSCPEDMCQRCGEYQSHSNHTSNHAFIKS